MKDEFGRINYDIFEFIKSYDHCYILNGKQSIGEKTYNELISKVNVILEYNEKVNKNVKVLSL